MPGFRQGGMAPGLGGFMDPIAPRPNTMMGPMAQPNSGFNIAPPMMNRGGPPPELGGGMGMGPSPRPMSGGANPMGGNMMKSFKPFNMGGGNVPITEATQRKFGIGNFPNQGGGGFQTTTNNPILSHWKKFNQPGNKWSNFGQQNRGAEVANRGGGMSRSFRPKRPAMGMF